MHTSWWGEFNKQILGVKELKLKQWFHQSDVRSFRGFTGVLSPLSPPLPLILKQLGTRVRDSINYCELGY